MTVPKFYVRMPTSASEEGVNTVSATDLQASRGESHGQGLEPYPSSLPPGPNVGGGRLGKSSPSHPHAGDPAYAWNAPAGCYSRLCESCRVEFAAWWDLGFAVCPGCHGGGRP